jgi:hypothetical protein
MRWEMGFSASEIASTAFSNPKIVRARGSISTYGLGDILGNLSVFFLSNKTVPTRIPTLKMQHTTILCQKPYCHPNKTGVLDDQINRCPRIFAIQRAAFSKGTATNLDEAKGTTF